jgi:hypothetical protein
MVESEENLVDERRQRLMAVRYRRELLVCGAEDASLLAAVFQADLAAFGAQSPELAKRYRD